MALRKKKGKINSKRRRGDDLGNWLIKFERNQRKKRLIRREL